MSTITETFSADCESDKITISVDQIKDKKTGANLPSKFADGDTYTIVCKYPATQVFTNDVRGQAGVWVTEIYEHQMTWMCTGNQLIEFVQLL